MSHLKKGEIVLYRAGEHMCPADEESFERLKKLKQHHYYSVTVKMYRNYKFHKKYFSMLNLAFHNQDEFDSFEWFRENTLIQIGHCETSFNREGKLLYKVKTISFSGCSELQFQELYDKTLTLLMKRYGFTKEFREELISYG